MLQYINLEGRLKGHLFLPRFCRKVKDKHRNLHGFVIGCFKKRHANSDPPKWYKRKKETEKQLISD